MQIGLTTTNTEQTNKGGRGLGCVELKHSRHPERREFGLGTHKECFRCYTAYPLKEATEQRVPV